MSSAEEPAQRRRRAVSRIEVAVSCAGASQRLRGRVAEQSRRRRRGIAKALQRRIRAVKQLAICDALSPEARAAAMIGE